MRHVRPRAWVALISAVVTGAVVVSSHNAATADPVRSPGVPSLIAERDFRAELGFDRRAEHLDAVRADPSSVVVEGMRFSRSEARELRQRIAAGEEINALANRHLAGARQTFGGVYLDHAAGGVMTVLVTSGASRHRAVLAARTAHPARLRVREVRYSLAALEAAQRRVHEASAALRRSGTEVVLSSIDVRRNRVTTVVGGPVEPARRALGTLVPAGMLDVVGGTARLTAVCSQGLLCRTESPPFDGGTDIESVDPLRFCTLGFVGHQGSSVQSYVLSAGHCGARNSVWAQQTTPIGVVSANSFRGTSLADAMAIPIAAELGRGYVKRSHNPPAFRAITGRERTSDDYIGKPTCAFGIRTALKCGTITTRTAIARFDSVTLKYQRIASRPCGPGDSGAPNYYNGRAQGITSFSVSYSNGVRHCGYSHIGNVLTALGLTSVTSR